MPIAAAVALNILGVSAFAQSEGPPRLIPAPQEPKPTFTLEDSERVSTVLNDLHGRPVLVHFFATWCEPCRVELPALQRLTERAGTLRVLTISVAEPEARVRTFLDKMPLTFPVLLDRDRSVARSWKVSALPTTYILDVNLQPRLFVESDYSWDQVDVPALENSLSNGGEQHAVPSP
ncbi:MAG: hypothetical protein BGP04_10165 [Rhizobiales bacterium 62-17]|nr:TlpA family protein disulfide reductase [Hyphomicrobiales bacterium]OJY05702.1 MAG: hypothetical protein BGP04_10165 [Rhizobiales bacterium 62-17]